MNTQFDFYLSHPVAARKLVREWELKFESETGFNLYNPMYDYEREEIQLLDLGMDYYQYNALLDPELIVLNDLTNVRKSRLGTVVFLPRDLDYHSYGTIMEMVYSKIIGKNIYALILNGYHDHPWLKFHSTQIFKELADLENKLRSLKNVQR